MVVLKSNQYGRGIEMRNCVNHPDVKAISTCHNCARPFCASCLVEGGEYYYCKEPACQEALKTSMAIDGLPPRLLCPNCSSDLELTKAERESRKFRCSDCDALVDYTVNPPHVKKHEEYALLLATRNEGDVAVIKSVLDDLEIDYFVFDEYFMVLDPLIQPTRFYVLKSQVERAKLGLKDFKVHLLGVSMNSGPEGVE